MNIDRLAAFGLLAALTACSQDSNAREAAAPNPKLATVDADPDALKLATQVMDRMGGRKAWDATHFIAWKFFGGHRHVWDKWSGDLRLEDKKSVVLMNLNTGAGRAFEDGVEVADATKRSEALENCNKKWINDSYWMFMPYKLLDPGVHLRSKGAGELAGGRAADVLELTFDKVGLTPQNRYLAYVARDSGLVEQWCYFKDAGDTEPGFTMPWSGWQRFDGIQLCTDHGSFKPGEKKDWEIAVYKDLPRSVFESPDPVQQWSR